MVKAIFRWLYRRMNPWACPHCLRLMRPFRDGDVTPEVKESHARAGTWEVVVMRCCRCDLCHDPDEAVMIY
jgi:hypothetical protein